MIAQREIVILMATDTDGDGQVDVLFEAIPSIPGFAVTGYADRGWSASEVWYRQQWDADHNGTFDIEGITGKWQCATPEVGCDTGPSPRN